MAEISVKLITKLMTKMLINSRDYDFSDVFFLASTLLNNSWHPAIKAVPSTLIFGHKTFDYGPLGTAQPAPRVTTRLLRPGYEKEVKELKKLIDLRIEAAKEAMQEARVKMQAAYNKGKISPATYKQGDIVFLKNFSLPAAGTSVKLRPVLQKSPFMVISVGPRKRALYCIRLTDNFLVQTNVDFVRRYRPKDKDDPAFKDLPPEMLKILGAPMTSDDIIRLAKMDKLDFLYMDRPRYTNETPKKVARQIMQGAPKYKRGTIEKPMTRAEKAKEKRALQKAALATLDSDRSTEDEENWEDVDEDMIGGNLTPGAAAAAPPKTVRFAASVKG
jgi:hypothetical protein